MPSRAALTCSASPLPTAGAATLLAAGESRAAELVAALPVEVRTVLVDTLVLPCSGRGCSIPVAVASA